MPRQLPIIAVLTDWYFEYQAEIVESIASELNAAGYGIVCITARELQPADCTDRELAVCNSIYPQVNEYDIRGLIALSGTLGHGADADTVRQFLENYSLPKVSLGMNIPGVASTHINEHKGMNDLMDHLLDTGSRKTFAFVRGHRNDPYSLNREQIFRDALKTSGHKTDRIFYLEGNYNPFETYQAVTDLLTGNENIDCIVAANDVMAASAARAAKAHGLRIPLDITISGFDDSSDATRHSPALTTVRQPVTKLACDSVRLLLEQIEQHEMNAGSENSTVELQEVRSISSHAELVIRRSTNPTDNETALNDSLDETKLRCMLNNAMHGLDIPDQITMRQISEPFWQTLENGSVDIISIATDITDSIIFQYSHWWLNICDQMQSICDQLIEDERYKANIALVGSAISIVKERVWALEMDKSFEVSRLQNARADMQLAMSSCNDIAGILSALDGWLEEMEPKRCFLVSYTHVGDKPCATAKLLHEFSHGESEQLDQQTFASADILPKRLMHELVEGLLVLSPVYADDMLFGYLLVDPRDTLLLDIGAAAQCIGNALRTHHHIKALQAQKASLQSVNEELAHLANFDVLTGLANRLQFQHYLKNCVLDTTETQHPFALLFIDLDGFKLINDTLGHGIGDLLLNQVAQRLLDSVAAHADFDGFISRLGGDEFTIILHQKNASANVEKITRAILELLSRPYNLNDIEVSVSASIGCALYPENAVEADDLIKYADIAMYRAKENGKNNIAIFSPEMISADTQELKLAQELRHALANNELCMHYQPRVDLKTGKMCAAEALMRWLIPSDQGLVARAYPDVFIALAEKIGVISQLDSYALNYVCKQAALWANDGTPLQISVNVSVNQLQQDDFVAMVMSAIEKHQLNPALLELEITESAAMTDVESNIAKLSQIKAAGIEVSIDDFGTGYSSLNYLKRLPVRNLKIDRSFIMDIVESDGGNSADAAIVRSVVALGKSMEFGLIAEGIETQAQHNFVQTLDCDQAQGYLYAKPQTADELTVILQQGLPENGTTYYETDQPAEILAPDNNKAA